VADTLEADWNDALRQLQTAQDDYERAATAARAAFTDEHKARIRALAADFPALWTNPATPNGNANAWPASSSKTSPSTRPITSTCTSASGVDRPPA
jgi:hypothetical protein